MASKVFLFSLLFIATLTDARSIRDTNAQIDAHDQAVIEFWLSGIRGFWFGFHKAFYHNKKTLDPLCLSINDEKYINTILEWLAYGELSDVFQMADAFYELYEENLQSCDVE